MILGLKYIYIPVQKIATTKKKIIESLEKVEQCLGWKIYFSGDGNGFAKTKMNVQLKNSLD
jgi:hypothetical protein